MNGFALPSRGRPTVVIHPMNTESSHCSRAKITRTSFAVWATHDGAPKVHSLFSTTRIFGYALSLLNHARPRPCVRPVLMAVQYPKRYDIVPWGTGIQLIQSEHDDALRTYSEVVGDHFLALVTGFGSAQAGAGA